MTVETERMTDPKIEFNLRAGELSTLEAEFAEVLLNLKRFHVPRNVMWALACKVFKQHPPVEPTPRQADIWRKKEVAIEGLANSYFDSMGENGYAALNVLTDFASRPVGMISAEQRVDALQRQSGGWMADFVSAIESRDFSFDRYLGEYAKLVA
jgi:hypothetical protein